MLLLSMLRYQHLLCFRLIPIATNKLYMLNFRYFATYLAISQQQVYQGFFKYGVYFFETIVY